MFFCPQKQSISQGSCFQGCCQRLGWSQRGAGAFCATSLCYLGIIMTVAIPWLLICPVCSISSLQLLWINRSVSISAHLSTSHFPIGPADPSRHPEPQQHLTSSKRYLWVRCCSPAWLRKSLCLSLLSKTFPTHPCACPGFCSMCYELLPVAG